MSILCLANPRLASCLVKLVTLKERVLGENPSFANHVGH
jgi:hypothetical protein